MAKFYGTAGTRRGTIGNEVYYICKSQNIIRKKPTSILNPRTIKQQTQRIKMKNCLLGFRNAITTLDLKTFANQKIVETTCNAYCKTNVALCSFLDKKTADIPNFPTITSNVICSYGTLTSIPLDNNYGYLAILLNTPYNQNMTIQNLTNALLNTYEFIRNRDAITLFYYYCENIFYDPEALYAFEPYDRAHNAIAPLTGRRTFILNTQNTEPIANYGLTTYPAGNDKSILTTSAISRYNTPVSLFDDLHPCFLVCFYARLIDGELYNFPISTSIFNKGYQQMYNFTQTPDYIDLCLQSFYTNIPVIVE